MSNVANVIIKMPVDMRKATHAEGFLSTVRSTVGEWLSLVEHLVRDQGVGGSNPLSPTNLFKHINPASVFPSP